MEKINLSKTAELMSSEDYKERFIAEYCQLSIRTQRLERVLKAIENKTAPSCFKPSCPVKLLEDQLKAMTAYGLILEKRAFIEGIEFPEVEI